MRAQRAATGSSGSQDGLARGLYGGNAFDTDNNETKAGQQTQETAGCFVAVVRASTRWAVSPPCNAVFPPWDAVRGIRSIRKIRRIRIQESSWRPERLFAEYGSKSLDCHSTNVTNPTEHPECARNTLPADFVESVMVFVEFVIPKGPGASRAALRRTRVDELGNGFGGSD
jgi:hypothetical protein